MRTAAQPPSRLTAHSPSHMSSLAQQAALSSTRRQSVITKRRPSRIDDSPEQSSAPLLAPGTSHTVNDFLSTSDSPVDNNLLHPFQYVIDVDYTEKDAQSARRPPSHVPQWAQKLSAGASHHLRGKSSFFSRRALAAGLLVAAAIMAVCSVVNTAFAVSKAGEPLAPPSTYLEGLISTPNRLRLAAAQGLELLKWDAGEKPIVYVPLRPDQVRVGALSFSACRGGADGCFE